ncbi:hypothetical protein ABIA14_005600 [Sinorhizobium fredii]
MSFLRDNGLSITLTIFTSATIAGMIFSGTNAFNQEAIMHGEPTVTVASYLATGHFLSALFENWESEFLQMAAYVCLTAFLYQRGSAESRDPDGPRSGLDEDPLTMKNDPSAPWPVRQGRLVRTLYSYSLGIALAGLFVLSFVFHLRASAAAAETSRPCAMASRLSTYGRDWQMPNSGSNAFRTGNRNSCPPCCWSSFPFSCVSAGRRSPSRSQRRTARPENSRRQNRFGVPITDARNAEIPAMRCAAYCCAGACCAGAVL